MNSRAQSESIGELLLVGIVVITLATAGAFALSNVGGSSTTNADISVEVNTSGFSFAHAGGDPLPMDQLVIVVRDGNRTLRPAFDVENISDGDDDDVFEPGERWTNGSMTFNQNDPVTVSLFDRRTNSPLLEETLYPGRV